MTLEGILENILEEVFEDIFEIDYIPLIESDSFAFETTQLGFI